MAGSSDLPVLPTPYSHLSSPLPLPLGPEGLMERDKERGTRRGKDKEMAVIHFLHYSGLGEKRQE